MKLVSAVLIIFAALSNTAHGETMTEAFNSAKTLGKNRNQTATNQIKAGNLNDKVPGYGQPTAEANYFEKGNGNTQAHGVSKLNTCASGGTEADPVKRQECEAVNFLAKNPEVRSRYNITKNDPMIINHRDQSAGAEDKLGEWGMGGNSTSCTTVQQPVDPTYEENSCLSLREVEPNQCTMGRIVKTDGDSNFQCNQTVNAYETLKCKRTVAVSDCPAGETDCIKQPTCSPGSLNNMSLQGASGMGGDACDGGDWLQVQWICSTDDNPSVRMLTNAKDSSPAGGNVANKSSLVRQVRGACYARFLNNTNCVDGKCSGTYTMILGGFGCDSRHTEWCKDGDCDNVCHPKDYAVSSQGSCPSGWTGPIRIKLGNDDDYSWGCRANYVTISSTGTCPSNYPAKDTRVVYRDSNDKRIYRCYAAPIAKGFYERSFGSASRIVGTASFAMAKRVKITEANACAALEERAK